MLLPEKPDASERKLAENASHEQELVPHGQSSIVHTERYQARWSTKFSRFQRSARPELILVCWPSGSESDTISGEASESTPRHFVHWAVNCQPPKLTRNRRNEALAHASVRSRSNGSCPSCSSRAFDNWPFQRSCAKHINLGHAKLWSMWASGGVGGLVGGVAVVDGGTGWGGGVGWGGVGVGWGGVGWGGVGWGWGGVGWGWGGGGAGWGGVGWGGVVWGGVGVGWGGVGWGWVGWGGVGRRMGGLMQPHLLPGHVHDEVCSQVLPTLRESRGELEFRAGPIAGALRHFCLLARTLGSAAGTTVQPKWTSMEQHWQIAVWENGSQLAVLSWHVKRLLANVGTCRVYLAQTRSWERNHSRSPDRDCTSHQGLDLSAPPSVMVRKRTITHLTHRRPSARDRIAASGGSLATRLDVQFLQKLHE